MMERLPRPGSEAETPVAAPRRKSHAVEHLGFWEDVRRIISGSELITGFPYTFTVPGLPQYLQSLTKLAIATAQAGEQAGNIPIFFSQLLESSFPEVRLLTLDALLERFSTAASGLGEKGLPPLLWNMGGTFLMLAMKENHPECFCKILKILHCMDPSEWLPQTEHCIHLTPKEFLIWTMDIASNERFAPSAPRAIRHDVGSVPAVSHIVNSGTVLAEGLRSEIQSVALRLASRVITHHLQTCEE
ncbi:hypothetical protein GH733_009350, partial [Mirounga leonina]